MPGIDRIPAFKCHRGYKPGVAIGKPHSGGHDTDDAPRDTVNADGLPDCIRISPEALLPIAVTQHHHGVASGEFVVMGKEAAQRGMNAQGVKCIDHHLGAEHPIGGIGCRHIRFRVCPKATDSGEGIGMLCQGPDPPFGKETDLAGAVFNPREPVLLRKRQGAEHDGVHQGEDRRVCPNSQRQSEDGGECESRRFSQLSQRESQVIQHSGVLVACHRPFSNCRK